MINVTTHYDRRKAAKGSEGHMMVSIKATEKGHKRTPVCISLVIDTSGSMNDGCSYGCNQSKLAVVKDTAKKIIENLTEDDQISIVGFAHHATLILPKCNITNKATLISAVNNLVANGGTNMSAGILEAKAQIDTGFKGVRRIMVLTDGQVNEGVIDTNGLVGVCKSSDGITFSTFGFGQAANQELLKAISKECSGNFYYIPGGNDVGVVFARELGGITSCVAQNIKLEITPGKDNELLELLNDFKSEMKDGKMVICADDIFAGETKHILVKMRVNDGKVAKVHLSFDHLKKSKRIIDDFDLKVDIVPEEKADKQPILIVQEQVALLSAAKAQMEAVKHASTGNYVQAQSVLRCAGVVLQDCANHGSSLCNTAVGIINDSVDDFTSVNYTSDYGATVSNSASNATKMRGGAVYLCSHNVTGPGGQSGAFGEVEEKTCGGLDGLYLNKSAKRMVKKFVGDKEKKKKA
jgi:Ca-activated chloride channel family protein